MNAATKVAVLGGAFALVGAAAYAQRGRYDAPVTRQVAPRVAVAPSVSAAPGTLIDAIAPQRPVSVAVEQPNDDWLKARPRFQYSRPASERGGVEPCTTQSVDTGGFSAWTALGRGRYVLPKQLAIDASGGFDLIIHLHGEAPVLRELVESQQRLPLYNLTLPPEQAYAPLFSGTHLYQDILSGMERAVSEQAGRPAHVEHVALSAWSAGFVGIEAVLAQPGSSEPDAVVLVDGLHAPRTDPAAFKAQLQVFVDFAARAAAGERFMFVSHSSIDPSDFASTTECAHYLIGSLGGKPQAVRREDPFGLELVEYFTRGDFHVRGYAGNDKSDHCAQLAVLRDVYAALGKRWSLK
jgi:hypothetical protein